MHMAYLSNDLPLHRIPVPDGHDVSIGARIAEPISAIHIEGQLRAMKAASSLQEPQALAAFQHNASVMTVTPEGNPFAHMGTRSMLAYKAA